MAAQHLAYEENHSKSSKDVQVEPILINSSSDETGSDHDAKFTTKAEDSCITLDATHLDIAKNSNSVVNIEIPIIVKGKKDGIKLEAIKSFQGSDIDSHVIANSSEMENEISDSAILKAKMNEVEKRNFRDENTTSVPENLSIKKKTNSSIVTHNACLCKMYLSFAACCIIGIYLIPFAVFAIQSRNNTKKDFDYSLTNEKNTSSANVTLMETCNCSALACVDQVLYTYEALRTVNLPSSQQYCSERIEILFCDALMECNNESYLKDIVCQQVRQEYCTSEWRMLEVNNQTEGLIECEKYEETIPLNCNDQFGLANNGSTCQPLCEEFTIRSNAVPYAISAVISIIGGLTVIGISIKKRKKMFIFPQILIVITAGIAVILEILLFIPAVSIGEQNILCSSRFLFDALDNPTAFCTFQGAALSSGSVVYSYLWTVYIVHLAIKLFYPIKSSKLFNSEHRRKIFFTEIAIAFFVGSVPSILIATVGPNYKIAVFPPIYCGNDGISLLLISVFPNLVAGFISHTLILLILHKLHIHGEGIFKRKHEDSSTNKPVCTCQFTVPELKVIIVLIYFLFLTIILWTSISTRGDGFDDDLRRFADCMAGGNRKDHDCQELREDLEAHSITTLEILSLLFLAFQSFASLPLVIQFQTIKKSIMQAFSRSTNSG